MIPARKVRRVKSNVGQRSLERKALYVLLFMAWGWILGFVGVVVYHLQKDGTTPKAVATSSSSLGVVPGIIPGLKPKNVDQPAWPVSGNTHAYESPLLIFTCQRANYLEKTLADIYDNIPRPCRFGCPIIVSEDGHHGEIQKVVMEFQAKFHSVGVPVLHMRHQQQQMLRGGPDAYHALAKHYGWALSQVFGGLVDPMMPIPQRVIILEEDINTAPDFFTYMEATSKLLDNDPSLFAVSAFNDNGHLVHDPKRLLRSDFFPGLGWMMTRKLWKSELESKWPAAYWDDWLREPDQRKDRQVIRPEFSRTFHFGFKGGASANQFGGILQQIKLNKENIDWTNEDLSYLEPNTYEIQYAKQIQQSQEARSVEEALELVKTGDVWLQYPDFSGFQHMAEKLNLMTDEKAMVPRTAYNGIVETRPLGNYLIFLTPLLQDLKGNMKGLD